KHMNQIYNLYEQVNEFVQQHKLSIMLILSTLIFILSGDALRQVDITAATIDLGVLAVLPLAAIAVISFMMLTQWIIAWQWPVLDEYQRNFLERTFKSLLSWQKVLIYFSFYLAILFSFIMVTMSFM